jgi:hypothetical protein
MVLDAGIEREHGGDVFSATFAAVYRYFLIMIA